MGDQRDGGTHDAECGHLGSPEGQIAPDGHSVLEEKAGFWDGKWAEVKRRFVKMAWEDEQSRMAIILGCAGILVGILWTLLFE